MKIKPKWMDIHRHIRKLMPFSLSRFNHEWKAVTVGSFYLLLHVFGIQKQMSFANLHKSCFVTYHLFRPVAPILRYSQLRNSRIDIKRSVRCQVVDVIATTFFMIFKKKKLSIFIYKLKLGVFK